MTEDKYESYIKNCFICARSSDGVPIFTTSRHEGLLEVKLDGYAIIPIEQTKYYDEMFSHIEDRYLVNG